MSLKGKEVLRRRVSDIADILARNRVVIVGYAYNDIKTSIYFLGDTEWLDVFPDGRLRYKGVLHKGALKTLFGEELEVMEGGSCEN